LRLRLSLILVYLYLAGAILTSCASSPVQEPNPPRYEDLKLSELESLAEEDPAEGVEVVLHLLSTDPVIDEQELRSLLKRSMEALTERYAVRLEAGELQAARADARTLRFLQEIQRQPAGCQRSFRL